jgi:hypothetical protein
MVLAVWTVLTLVLVLVVDLIAALWGQPDLTVSYIIYDYGRRYPFLYFLLGGLVFHLVFPLVLTIRNGN